MWANLETKEGFYDDSTLCLGTVSASTPGTAPLVSESWMSSRMAFESAGVGPEDIDFVEIPDNSSWHYLQYPETLGFFKPGETERYLKEGATLIGGKLPINPSGGLASFGEAVAATGLAQICEVAWQLREQQCGARQVHGAKVGMGQTYGMLGNSVAVILKK